MATGEAVPGLDLCCGDLVLTTDSGGTIQIPPGSSGALSAIQGGPWRVARAVPERRGADTPVLWVYRMMEVRGQITAESSLARLEFGQVELVAVGGLPARGETNQPDETTLARGRLRRVDVTESLTPEGSFLVELPCVPGYRLTARVPGWMPDSVALTTEPSQFVSLCLKKKSLAIKGTLRDSTGTPLAGASIQVFVIIVMPLSELDRAAIKVPGHSYTLGTNRKKNRAVLKYHVSTGTKSDGSFEVEVNAKGRLVIVAKPRGDFHTTIVERASFEGDVDDLAIVAAAGRGHRVRVVRSGVPFHGRIAFVDVTRTDQHAVIPDLKESNEFFGATLIPGHQYSVLLLDQVGFRAFLVWDERSTIDLALLVKEPDLTKVSPERR